MIIRRLKEEDLKTRVEWMNSPAIYESMHYDIPVTYEKTLVWFHNNEVSDKRADLVVEDEGEILAFCGITGIDKVILKGEIYTFVNPFKKHKGIGTKTKMLMVEYAFTELKLNKLFSITNEDNIPSFKINEKLGFVKEGQFRREYLTKDGELKDRLYWGLLKEDWEMRNNHYIYE